MPPADPALIDPELTDPELTGRRSAAAQISKTPISAPRVPLPQVSAILLAGGRGSRMGGVEKALLRRAGQTQIQRWLKELDGRDIRTVVVGPASLRREIPTSVPLVQETPAFAGPAAGVRSGAAELDSLDRDFEPDPGARSGVSAAVSEWTLLLAVDLTAPAALLDWLLDQLVSPAAVLPCDDGGREQYLSAAVPTGWLMRRTAALSPAQAQNRPLRWLLQGLEESCGLRRPVLPRGLSEDVDTLDDAHRLGISLP